MTRRGTKKKINLRRTDLLGDKLSFRCQGARISICRQLEIWTWSSGEGDCSFRQQEWFLQGQAGMHPQETQRVGNTPAPLTKVDAPPPPHWKGRCFPTPAIGPSVTGSTSHWSENALYGDGSAELYSRMQFYTSNAKMASYCGRQASIVTKCLDPAVTEPSLGFKEIRGR